MQRIRENFVYKKTKIKSRNQSAIHPEREREGGIAKERHALFIRRAAPAHALVDDAELHDGRGVDRPAVRCAGGVHQFRHQHRQLFSPFPIIIATDAIIHTTSYTQRSTDHPKKQTPEKKKKKKKNQFSSKPKHQKKQSQKSKVKKHTHLSSRRRTSAPASAPGAPSARTPCPPTPRRVQTQTQTQTQTQRPSRVQPQRGQGQRDAGAGAGAGIAGICGAAGCTPAWID